MVDDVTVIAGEPDDELVPIRSVAQRQRGQIDGGGPSLRVLPQRCYVLVRQPQLKPIVE